MGTPPQGSGTMGQGGIWIPKAREPDGSPLGWLWHYWCKKRFAKKYRTNSMGRNWNPREAPTLGMPLGLQIALRPPAQDDNAAIKRRLYSHDCNDDRALPSQSSWAAVCPQVGRINTYGAWPSSRTFDKSLPDRRSSCEL
jgi:hypothetical protein